MPFKVDWLWLLVGIAIALLFCKGAKHDKSPLSGVGFFAAEGLFG